MNSEKKRTSNLAHEDRRLHPCADGCGRLVNRKAVVCVPCNRKARQGRRELILSLWNEGKTHREIAKALDTTPASIQVTLSVMRKGGWDVPRRGPGGAR